MNYKRKFFKLGDLQLEINNMKIQFINNQNKMQQEFKKVFLFNFKIFIFRLFENNYDA